MSTETETKTIPDSVVERLRESMKSDDADMYQQGWAAGEAWATAKAEASHLINLERFKAFWDSQSIEDWLWFFSGGGNSAYTTADHFYFGICPADDGNREAANDFWEFHVGENHERLTAAGEFLRGFAEGAWWFWSEVKAHL